MCFYYFIIDFFFRFFAQNIGVNIYKIATSSVLTKPFLAKEIRKLSEFLFGIKSYDFIAFLHRQDCYIGMIK